MVVESFPLDVGGRRLRLQLEYTPSQNGPYWKAYVWREGKQKSCHLGRQIDRERLKKLQAWGKSHGLRMPSLKALTATIEAR